MLRYRDEVDFAANMSKYSNSKMSYPDFGASLSSFCWPTLTDIKSVLQDAIEETEDNTRQISFLGKHLLPIIQVPEMRKQVSQMMEEELQQYGASELYMKSASLNEKVSSSYSHSLATYTSRKDPCHLYRIETSTTKFN